MKALVFDTSSIITLATNDLLWTLKPLRKMFQGNFYIPYSVKRELVDVPINGRKFKLEAMMIKKIIEDGDLNLYEIGAGDILNKVNSVYLSKENIKSGSPGGKIKILDRAEVEALLLSIKLNAVYVVDERTMRLFIEDPRGLRMLLENKLHTRVNVDNNLLKDLRYNVGIIRTTELMIVAFENGLLDNFIKDGGKANILDALLWGLRLRGCAISTNEIEELKRNV